MKKIFFSDIVGTFIDEQGNFTKKNIEIIKNIRKQGILFVFLTSQDYQSVKNIVDTVKPDFFIGALGEEIYDHNLKLIHKIENSSKGKAAKWLIHKLKTNSKHAGAVGDTKYDISMFEEVEYSYAMGNGTDEAKKSALYITKDVAENGLGLALEEFAMHMQVK